MKLVLIILTLLLVGCLASTTVKYEVEKYQVSQDIDKKIELLEQERQKLEKARTELEKTVKIQASKPPPIIVMSRPDHDSYPVIVPRQKIESNEPIDSREPTNLPTRPAGNPITKNVPNNTTVAEQLYKASAVFAIPNKANIKDNIKAQLIIDPTKTIEEIKKDVTVGLIKEAKQIKISKIVIAKLNAPDFEIISAPSVEQAIIEDGKTEWVWGLRPKNAGLHPINLIVEAQVTVGDKMTPHLIRTFDKQVMIEITATQTIASWWNKYWQWILSTLVLPFVIWVYQNKFVKKEKLK